MNSATPTRSRTKKVLIRAGIGFGILAAAALAFASHTGLLRENFRLVEPARFYPSGQMSPESLRETLQTWGIKG